MSEDNKFVLSEDFLNQIRYFIQDKDTQRVSRNLRMVFFYYLRFQASGLPLAFDEIMNDIEATIELLEAISRREKYLARYVEVRCHHRYVDISYV